MVEDEKVLIVRKAGCNQAYIDVWSVGARLTRGPIPTAFAASVLNHKSDF
jgi:hypothetical protein